jgi:hypothetical protein
MAAGTVSKFSHDRAVIIQMLFLPIVIVTRQTEVRARRAVSEVKRGSPFIRGSVTAAAVLADIVATAQSFGIIGDESGGRSLIGISPKSDRCGSRVTFFTNSGLGHVTERQTLERRKGVTADTILVGNMGSSGTFRFVTAIAGFRRWRMIETADDRVELGKAVATNTILLRDMGRRWAVLFMTAVAGSWFGVMKGCAQASLE